MASRRFKQFRSSLETAVVDLFLQVSFGASGAPTLATTSPKTNQGIASIVKDNSIAGKYTITLTDPYVRIMNLEHRQLVATGTPAAPFMYLISDTVSTASAPAFVIQFLAVDGTTATNPASGEIALISVILKNSSVM